jgi:hyaluronan synthase
MAGTRSWRRSSSVDTHRRSKESEQLNELSTRYGIRGSGLRYHYPDLGTGMPLSVAPQETCRGALADSYDIPRAEYRRSRIAFSVTVGTLLIALLFARHIVYIWDNSNYRWLLCVWMLGTILVSIQWILSWLDRPATVTEEQAKELAHLKVAVTLPVWNESPAILDRTLWALVNQSHPPSRIDVIDDGSEEDYTVLHQHWAGSIGRTWIRWIRQENQGKKRAQARSFSDPLDAEITITVDSDSALAFDAIERGIRPFADPDVWSVAGVELALNFRENWLTRTVYARTLFFQVISCGAQSAFGDILVNRGPFALYRSELLKDIVPAYLDETFLGKRIKLGDDAALTLFARCRGKAVQQSDAFAFSMFPESMSHHLRQWTRWMRGSVIRNCWRIKYLKIHSYSWWFTLVSMQLFLMAISTPMAIIMAWPSSRGVLLWMLGAMVPWSYLSGLRIFSIRRTDETKFTRFVTWLTYPTSILWMLFVLHWIRVYSIITWYKQGWNTRVAGAETLTVPTQAWRETG